MAAGRGATFCGGDDGRFPGSSNVLFFIPDIGGFTKFVTETEISHSHSQHIVSALLELLVDSNELGLEVSEFEGDAVPFFRSGELPAPGQTRTPCVQAHYPDSPLLTGRGGDRS